MHNITEDVNTDVSILKEATCVSVHPVRDYTPMDVPACVSYNYCFLQLVAQCKLRFIDD